MRGTGSCALALVVIACGGKTPSHADSNAGDGGGDVIDAPVNAWTWVPIDGMVCADGSPTGIGVDLSDASDDVMIFMQGGGACWDLNTCFTQMTAVHITGGYGQADFQSEIGQVGSATIWQRTAGNPFANASYVYVPYCTGDLHDGDNVATFDPSHVVHFAGRTGTAALIARVAATRPRAKTVWLIGISAGAFGVELDWDLAQAAWPDARVHVLSDSGPLVSMQPSLWSTMQTAWHMTLPPGCTGCTADMAAIEPALRAEFPAADRYGLMSYTRDQTITSYFGITMDQFQSEVTSAQAAMSPSRGDAALLLTGTTHVVFSTPTATTSQGTGVTTWVEEWATGDPAWANAGP